MFRVLASLLTNLFSVGRLHTLRLFRCSTHTRIAEAKHQLGVYTLGQHRQNQVFGWHNSHLEYTFPWIVLWPCPVHHPICWSFADQSGMTQGVFRIIVSTRVQRHDIIETDCVFVCKMGVLFTKFLQITFECQWRCSAPKEGILNLFEN